MNAYAASGRVAAAVVLAMAGLAFGLFWLGGRLILFLTGRLHF
jgi:hypothetical protein